MKNHNSLFANSPKFVVYPKKKKYYHKQHQDNMWNHWYFLSFYDASPDIIHREASLPDRQIIAEEMGLKMPDIMFTSEKQDITPEFLNDYLGKSNTTATPNNGEGIVVECAGRRAKIRVDEFREVKKRSKSSKTHKMTSSEQFIKHGKRENPVF